jgi:hypothetical protein
VSCIFSAPLTRFHRRSLHCLPARTLLLFTVFRHLQSFDEGQDELLSVSASFTNSLANFKSLASSIGYAGSVICLRAEIRIAFSSNETPK